MRASIEYQIPDEPVTAVDVVHPGMSGYFYTEADNGSVCDSYLIACPPDNEVVEIHFVPNESSVAEGFDPETIAGQCTEDTLVTTLYPGETRNCEVYDTDIGRFRLIIGHCFVLSDC